MKTIYNKEYNLPLVENTFTKLGVDANERFKHVFGNERYLIGDLGTVISLTNPDKPIRVRIQRHYKHAYLNYSFSYKKGGRPTTERIHRLVAIHFVPRDREEATTVNHINGNPVDNMYTNLEWVTQEENAQHAKDNDLYFKGMRVYQIYNESGTHIDTVIGLGGLRQVWEEDLADTTYYNRVYRGNHYEGLKAVAVGTVGELFGHAGAMRLKSDIEGLV